MRRHFLAVVGLAVLLASCGGDDKPSTPTTTRRTTTTSTAPPTTTTGVTVPTTTTAAPVATTRAASGHDCSSRAIVGGSSALQAPAVGTYRFVGCATGATVSEVVVGAGGSGNERTVSWAASFGSVTGLNAYDAAVTQASATVRPRGVTAVLTCTWDNPMTMYPAGLALNSTWRTDGRCDMDFRQSLQFNRFSRATGLRSFTVNGQSVRVLVIEETTDVLYVDNPRRNSTSWHSESTIFLDPARGLPVYERRIAEATGQYPQPKTTTEAVLG